MGLFRRLSHLIRRRPKSESFATDVLRQLALDLSDDEQQATYRSRARSLDLDSSTESTAPFIFPPHLLDTLPHNAIPGSINDVLIVLANLERRIPILETQNAQLEANKNRILFESQLREQEINLKHAQVARQRSYLSQLRGQVEQAMKQYEKHGEDSYLEDFLLKTLASCPPDHLFHKIALAIDAGSSFELAIVSVIQKEIETKPGSPWSTLVPAVVGPRTSDQYGSALSVVLQARRDLTHGKNVSHYWKSQAQMDDANLDIITPSSSLLSDIQEQLSEERQRAVDDLLMKLRNGEIPVRSRVVTQAAIMEAEEEGRSEEPMPLPLASASPNQLSPVVNLEVLAVPEEDDLKRLSTLAVPPLSEKSLLDPASSTSQVDPPQEVTLLVLPTDSNSIPTSSTTRSSLAPAVSISSVSSSSVSSFASTDLSDIWEFAMPLSLSLSNRNTSASTSISHPQDTGDISSFPTPVAPVRPARPTPRINPFNGLETIDETDEPSSASASASSSSNYLSSGSSSREGNLDVTLVDPGNSLHDVTLVHDEIEMVEVKKPLEDVVSMSKQPRSPIIPAMSKLPRRLSLLLKGKGQREQGKEKEMPQEKKTEKKKDTGRKEPKPKNSTSNLSILRPASTSARSPVLSSRKNPPPPLPLPVQKKPPPPELIRRARANSASSRPTISSMLKQTTTPPRQKRKGKENVDMAMGDRAAGAGSPVKVRNQVRRA